MGHMIGLPNFSFLDMHMHPLIYAGTLLALTIAFIVYGFDIIKSGCKNLIHKAPNMDTLVAMGVITSILYSLYGMYMIAKGHHEYVENLYFESAAIVIFFIKLGRYIDGISKDKTKEAIQKLVQITPKEAVIKVNGEEITKLKGNKLNKFRREDLGFIFQDFNLLDTLTAYENIALALSIQNVSPKEIDKRIKKVAKELDIESVLKKYPYQMSGGQKQRVAAARAIITNPKLILADEPTGALDSKSSKMLLEKLTYLNNNLGATILMVTHDAYAASYATRIIFIKDGKIYNEIRKGNDTRKEFFDKIIDVVTLLGGDINDAL